MHNEPSHFHCIIPGPEVIKLFSYSTQLGTKFILLINGILTFISMINTTSKRLKQEHEETSLFVGILVFYEQ